MTLADPHPDRGEVSRLLSIFSERPTEVLAEPLATERRERVTSHIRALLSDPRTGTASRFASKKLPVRFAQASVGLALAAGVGLFIRHQVSSPSDLIPAASLRLIESSGAIHCRTAQGPDFRACDPVAEPAPDGLRTLAGAHLTVETQIGVRLLLSAESTLLLSDSSPLAGRSRVSLASGKVDVSVPKLGPTRQFQVLTPTATVTVHGTAFSVTVQEFRSTDPTHDAKSSRSTCVELREGTITVEGEGRTDKLTAPASWGCRPPESPLKSNDAPVSPDALEKDALEKDALEKAAPAGSTAALKFDSSRSRSTLALETRLLQTALVAERSGNQALAERNLKTLLSTYPHSVVAPDARAALERMARRRAQATKAR